MPSITAQELRSLLKCDFDTGELFWLPRPVDLFATRRAWTRWSNLYPGKLAAQEIHSAGYFKTRIFAKAFYTHRVIWALAYGEWPCGEIDHINSIRTDNRLANLRVVGKADNAKNLKLYATNKSGHPGVSFVKKTGHWTAVIKSENKKHYLGYFVKIEDAIAARESAERRYNFHEMHGRK